jgi:hypothetical protein
MPPRGSATESPAVPSSGPSADAGAAALASYRQFWHAQVQAQADPTKDEPPALRVYAIDRALASVESAMLLYRQQGIAVRGALSFPRR